MPRRAGETFGRAYCTARHGGHGVGNLILAAMLSIPGSLVLPGAYADVETHIYLLRHAEVDGRSLKRLLNETGRARAEMLGDRFRDVEVTHVFATSTSRSYETVAPLARRHGLTPRRIPTPGSSIDGRIVVLDRGDPTLSIGPMLETLHALPAGSTAVVGTDSASLFAIMAGLEVEVRDRCDDYESCLPCGHAGCFPEDEFDNLWLVIPRSTGGAVSSRIRYGDPLELLTGFKRGKRTREVNPELMGYD